MRRRAFLVGAVGAVAAGLTLVVGSRLATPRVPTVGFLSNVSLADPRIATIIQGFRDGLREEGLMEDTHLHIEWRFAEGRNELLPELAADLVSRNVQAIVTTGGTVPPYVRRATDRIPVVAIGGGLVDQGLATSYARPGGNITGIISARTN